MQTDEDILKGLLKRTIFDVTEFLVKHELSNSGKKLIINYFNNSNESTSELKAIDAINRYTPDSLDMSENAPRKLKELLNILAITAGNWDNF